MLLRPEQPQLIGTSPDCRSVETCPMKSISEPSAMKEESQEANKETSFSFWSISSADVLATLVRTLNAAASGFCIPSARRPLFDCALVFARSADNDHSTYSASIRLDPLPFDRLRPNDRPADDQRTECSANGKGSGRWFGKTCNPRRPKHIRHDPVRIEPVGACRKFTAAPTTPQMSK